MAELVRESRQNLSRLNFVANKLENEAITEKIKDISEITSRILQNAGKSAGHTGNVRFFLNYYLPVMIKIVSDYSAIEKQKILGSRAEDLKMNIEALVDDAEKAFQKQLESTMEDKIIDISAEIKVFRKSLIEDGYLTDETASDEDEDMEAVDFAEESDKDADAVDVDGLAIKTDVELSESIEEAISEIDEEMTGAFKKVISAIDEEMAKENEKIKK